ncbi:hypothetical protein D1164_10535 [Mariniphaga sediminis]|uniref:DUF4380 domain-containing protein n=1 Tax=Mariniphaga sediminis TaxID=1628158 RepID=A0A399D097_9BACT|nr:hypothetical protein [Mariniphaga sediminis]RIH65017.1 hypothetical protein D1164_10535 [Mariniphaga sediminis]
MKKSEDVLKAFEKSGKRTHLTGDLKNGVIAALDMEGRLFTILDGVVLNRINEEAIMGQSTRERYLNPGGDTLWPAPEGTTLGYQYATGSWRVSPSVTSARYLVESSDKNNAAIVAETELINNQGLGIPLLFKREINIEPVSGAITVNVVESITYMGRKPVLNTECLLAPWTLCQFDSGAGCEVVFPGTVQTKVWDLYEQGGNTDVFREEEMCRVQTDGSQKYQIALGPDVPWIEYHDPQNGLTVRRTASALPEGQSYIDIRDAAPDVAPDKKGVRYSIYSDTDNFMEIEAVGGCPEIILPGTELKVSVSTKFFRT